MTSHPDPIGLKPGTVKLVPYSEDWPRQFDAEAVVIRKAMGDLLLGLEHIGSTAIPGLDAKPIIDMAASIESLSGVPSCMERLATVRYEYKGEHGLPGRHFFIKGDPTIFHLHVVEQESNHWRVWIKFRDHLRQHEDVRREYNEVKRTIAKKFASNRDAYTAAKNPFISRILKQLESS